MGEIEGKNRTESEIKQLLESVRKNPENAAAYNRLGGLYYRGRKLEEAEEAYRRAMELVPHHPAYHNNLGNVLCDLGRMDDGLKEYEAAVAIDSETFSEAHVNLELARLEKEIIRDRVQFLEKALDLGVEPAESRTALGCAELLKGRLKEALRGFRAITETDAGYLPAAVNTAFTLTIFSPEKAADPSNAQSEIEKLAERFPESGRLKMHGGELLERVGDVAGAAKAYIEALKKEPFLWEAVEILGRSAPQVESARAMAEQYAAEQENVAAEKDGKSGGGTEDFEPLAARGRAAMLRFLLSWPYSEPPAEALDTPQGKSLLETLEYLESWCNRHPESAYLPHAVLLQARLLAVLNRVKDNADLLKTAAERFGDNPEILSAGGAACIVVGDLETGVDYLRRASLIAPDDAALFFLLRLGFEELRRYRRAQLYFNRAVRNNPADTGAHLRMARAALEARKITEAENLARKAAELNSKDPVVFTVLGEVLREKKNTRDAVEAYRKVLELDPGDGRAANALAELLLSEKATIPEGLKLLEEIRRRRDNS